MKPYLLALAVLSGCGDASSSRPQPVREHAELVGIAPAPPDTCGDLCSSLLRDGCLPIGFDRVACLSACAAGFFADSTACILKYGGARCAMHCCNLPENDGPGACRDSSACGAGTKCSALARDKAGACSAVSMAGTCACVSVEVACYNPGGG